MTGIKKVDKGRYGSYIVTRKGGWGVFLEGRMISWSATKSGAEFYLQRVLKQKNKEVER